MAYGRVQEHDDVQHFRVIRTSLSALILSHRQFYSDLDKERPTPLRYADFPLPLERGAVRLAVLLPPGELCAAAAEAARAIEGVLPPGAPTLFL